MNSGKPVKIVALGKYLPAKIDSSQLEEKYGIPSGWSEKNSGVSTRHQVTFESGAYMGARAIERALEKANISLSEIDLIIAACATYDHPIPNNSSMIKNELSDGNKYHIATLDIDSTCLSFVSGFEVAAKILDGYQYRNIILVSSEISSKGLDPENTETFTLFGDAAVAAILRYDETSDSRFIKGGLQTYSEGVDCTTIMGGGNSYYFKDFPYDPKLHSFKMEGIKLLKLAKLRIPEFMNWFFSDLQYDLLDVDVVIPHQASKTGLMVFKNLYAFKEDQLKENLRDYGNCISASIPLVLHDEIENGKIKRGDLCMLTGTSAGFSIGGILIRY